MRKSYSLLILFAVTCGCLGCGGGNAVDVSSSASDAEGSAVADPEAGAAAESEAEGVIAYSAMTLTNPFFTIIADSIREAAAAEGFQVIVEDADRDVKKQAEQIESYITRGVSAIVINPCDGESIGPAVRRANDAGIPVFTCDLQCVAEGAEVKGHVGTDNLQGGRLAGEAMIEALGAAGGKVLILHFKQAPSCVLRVQGFREVIEKYNAGRETGKIEIVSVLEGGGLRDEGFAATSAAIQSDPDLAGIFAINDPSGLGAYAALEQAGKADQVKIVAFDGQIAGKQAIKEGKIYADPIQFPEKMGRATVRNIVAYLNGDDFPKVQLIETRLYRREDALNDPELE